MELAFEEGKAYIRKSYSRNPEIRTGAQLLSIDGIPLREIQDKIHPYKNRLLILRKDYS